MLSELLIGPAGGGITGMRTSTLVIAHGQVRIIAIQITGTLVIEETDATVIGGWAGTSDAFTGSSVAEFGHHAIIIGIDIAVGLEAWVTASSIGDIANRRIWRQAFPDITPSAKTRHRITNRIEGLRTTFIADAFLDTVKVFIKNITQFANTCFYFADNDALHVIVTLQSARRTKAGIGVTKRLIGETVR